MSFLWESDGKRPMGLDGTDTNCYGMGMGQINMSHGQPWRFAPLDFKIWYFSINILAKKHFSFSFGVGKMKFNICCPPIKKSFWHTLKHPALVPPSNAHIFLTVRGPSSSMTPNNLQIFLWTLGRVLDPLWQRYALKGDALRCGNVWQQLARGRCCGVCRWSASCLRRILLQQRVPKVESWTLESKSSLKPKFNVPSYLVFKLKSCKV